MNEFYHKTTSQQIEEYNKWEANWPYTRTEIINFLIQKNDYKRYLEIGTQQGHNFREIIIDHKESIDPVPGEHVIHVMKSDDFFNKLDESVKYDIIFVDGLHHSTQVYKDIQNALIHLSEKGTIICHDMNPQFEITQRLNIVVNMWHGDCWKAFVKIRSERGDLNMYTIDTDCGLGIITHGEQTPIDVPEDLYYAYLETNRKYVLNLVDANEFIETYKPLK